MRRAKGLIAVAAIAGMLATACGKSTPSTSSSTSPGGVTDAPALSADGSTFAQPIYQQWAGEFKGSQVTYQGTGSGQGQTDVVNGTVGFAGSDVPLVTSTANGNLLNIPIGVGLVAVTYKLAGVAKLQLSGATLGDIFQGTIAKWNDAEIAKDNPGVNLPATPITVVVRSDGSGTSQVFTTYLAKFSNFKLAASKTPAWPKTGQFKAGNGSSGVEAYISGNSAVEGSIGYVELSYAKGANTPTIAIQNADKSAYVAPTADAMTAAAASIDASKLTATSLVLDLLNQPGTSSYPIATTTYALIFDKPAANPTRAKAAVDFLNYGLTTGQKDLAGLDFAPLPAAIATKCIAALRTVTYNGSPLLS